MIVIVIVRYKTIHYKLHCFSAFSSILFNLYQNLFHCFGKSVFNAYCTVMQTIRNQKNCKFWAIELEVKWVSSDKIMSSWRFKFPESEQKTKMKPRITSELTNTYSQLHSPRTFFVTKCNFEINSPLNFGIRNEEKNVICE